MELPDCPKCDGKMVPISTLGVAITGHYPVLTYAKWICVKCKYSIDYSTP